MATLPLAAIVLAAGKGTRMKSELPKVLHQIAGRPLLAFSLDLAVEVGANPIALVLGHGRTLVEAQLSTFFSGSQLRIAVQAEPRGTADAVRSAADALREHPGKVLILSGDVPLLRRASLDRLLEAGRTVRLAFLTALADDPKGYGRIVRDTGGRVQRIVEERDATELEREIREINAGIYLIDSQLLWEGLAGIGSSNAQGEFYLTDLVKLAAAQDDLKAVSAEFAEVAGVNDRCQLAAAEQRLRAELNRRHQLAGVTLRDPEHTYLDATVQLGQDVVIEPGCILSGRTVVGDGVHLKAYSVLEDAELAPGCIVGPFARLRPGTILGPNVHLGNFVEIKNSRIGNGSKANHLSYLGDADVGSGVNVGAGTITCNYDGSAKHRTTLADGVFIGSDSQLIAPVNVGAGAYVGAGTTVTEDVPPDALAVSRTTQVNVPGWAARRRAQRGKKR